MTVMSATTLKRLSLSLLCFFLSLNLFTAQSQVSTKGRIVGIVVDSETGETILGANVFVEGTTIGAATDLDGAFSINVPPGTYTIIASVVGYTKTAVTDVDVADGATVEVRIVLKPTVIETEEIVIEAKAALSYEAAVLTRQKQAASISDGISAEQIKRSPDATSGDALRRLSGISLVDNKFIFIRGVTDRYNQATLNGATLASTHADKKSFSFDMLPSNLLENTIVTKSATPDLPGDFTGGLVQLNTLDFPETMVLRLAYGSSYNDISSLAPFSRSQGSSTDWLAQGAEFRAMPNSSHLSDFAQSLSNTWPSRSVHAPLNQSFSLSYGDRFSVGGDFLGLVSALSYRNGFQRSEVKLDEERYGQFVRKLEGTSDLTSVMLGGILDVSYKMGPMHKFSLRNNYNRTADDRIAFSQGLQESDGRQKNYTSEWTERSIYTGQAAGEHRFTSLLNLEVAWQASLSTSQTVQPDRKEVQYSLAVEYPESDPYIAEPGTRSWSTLNDRSRSFKLDMAIPVTMGKVKFGAFQETRKRNYDVRYFQTVNPSNPQYFVYTIYPIDSIYAPAHFRSGGFSMQEITKPSDTYAADQSVFSTYLMVDMPFDLFSNKFRFVGGVRIEDATQRVHTTKAYSVPEPYTAVKKNIDVMPSANLTYSMNEITNIRIAFSRTVNRPELRELANVFFYDFNTYEGVFGNPNLRRATIENVDVRFEMYPGVGELFALSYFHKRIHDPIEEKFLYSSAPERTWVNSDDGTNFGWEIELRKDFGFISDYFSNLSVGSNYSRIFSQVQFRETVKDPVTLRDEVVIGQRPMQGQSSYMINLSVQFKEPTFGTSLALLYNRYGRRLDAIADYGDFDIFEKARSVVDVSISQPLPLSGLEARFSVKNAGDSRQIFVKNDKEYRVIRSGSTYSMQLSMSF